MLRNGEDNENSKKTTTRGLISIKASLHVPSRRFCTFLWRCFARLQRETSRNFLVTRFMEEMLYARVPVHFLFFSLPNIFTLIAASISPFLTAAMTFSGVSSCLYTKVAFFFFSIIGSTRASTKREKEKWVFSSPPYPHPLTLAVT